MARAMKVVVQMRTPLTANPYALVRATSVPKPAAARSELQVSSALSASTWRFETPPYGAINTY